MPREREPRVVAELGRPETPAETAARKAENSRTHRANQTVTNLILALATSLAVVFVIVLVVVRPDQPPRDPVDYAVVAEQAQPASDIPLAAPTLPEGWTANSASLRAGRDDESTWSIGLITPANQFIALEQGIGVTDAWVGDFLGDAQPTSTTDIDGVSWDVYDRRDADDPGNFAYSLAATLGGSEILLHGTADDDEFIVLASGVIADLGAE